MEKYKFWWLLVGASYEGRKPHHHDKVATNRRGGGLDRALPKSESRNPSRSDGSLFQVLVVGSVN